MPELDQKTLSLLPVVFSVLYSLSRNKIKGVSDWTIGIVLLSSAS